MQMVNKTQADLTGTVLGLLLTNRGGPAEITDVQPLINRDGSYEPVIAVGTAWGDYEIYIVPASRVIQQELGADAL